MDGTRVTPLPWLDPEALFGFIDELREAGYKISLPQYIAAQDLILILTSRNEDLTQPQTLKGFLGPLLCSSPSEQEDFQRRYDQWVQRWGFTNGDDAPGDEDSQALGRELVQIERRSQLWRWGLAGALVMIVAGLILYLLLLDRPPEPLNGSSAVPGESPTGVFGIVQYWPIPVSVVSLLLVWYLRRRWRAYRARLFLVRRPSTTQPEIKLLSIQASDGDLFPRIQLFQVAQGLRRRTEVPSDEIDVNETVTRTAQLGGWITPVFQSRQVAPEYLALVDRTSYSDHQARFVQEILASLSQDGVFITVYYFDADPRICFPLAGDGHSLTLWDISLKHPQYRLCLFSSANRLLSPLTGELEPWTDLFTAWDDRSVFTPEPIDSWGYLEQELLRTFDVYPVSLDGFTSAVRKVEPHETYTASPQRFKAPLPVELRRRPRRWIERDSPEPAQIDAVLESLRLYLGDEGYHWLSACAVYPTLHWNLTLYLGSALHTENEQKLLQSRRLLELARLPWFRHGYMPDWLRIELISSLSPQRERDIRSALELLLVTSSQGSLDDFHLAIAREHRPAISVLARPVLRILSRSAPEDSPLRDHVFMTFMAGRRQRKLAVRLPEVLHRRLAVRLERRTGLLSRMFGAATLRAQVYRDVRADTSATKQAILVAIFSALAGGVGAFGTGGATLLGGMIRNPINLGVTVLVVYAGGRLIFRSHGSRASLGQTFRTLAFSQSPLILGVFGLIPSVGALIGLVVSLWWLITFTVAIKETFGYRSAWRALAFLAIVYIPIIIIIIIGLAVIFSVAGV